MENFYKKSHQSGRSMIEMLGVLAIIGVLSIGGIAGYSKAMEKHNINKLKDQLSTIVANLTMVLANGRDSAQITSTSVAKALNILPSEMVISNGCRHALGGNCYVGPGGPKGNFTLRFADLPKSACIELVTFYTPSNGMVAINSRNNIWGTAETCNTEDGSPNCLQKKKRTLDEAIQECRGEKNAVVFSFGLKI